MGLAVFALHRPEIETFARPVWAGPTRPRHTAESSKNGLDEMNSGITVC